MRSSQLRLGRITICRPGAVEDEAIAVPAHELDELHTRGIPQLDRLPPRTVQSHRGPRVLSSRAASQAVIDGFTRVVAAWGSAQAYPVPRDAGGMRGFRWRHGCAATMTVRICSPMRLAEAPTSTSSLRPGCSTVASRLPVVAGERLSSWRSAVRTWCWWCACCMTTPVPCQSRCRRRSWMTSGSSARSI